MDDDVAGALQAAMLVDDPVVLGQHREWRDSALAQSITVADYAAAERAA